MPVRAAALVGIMAVTAACGNAPAAAPSSASTSEHPALVLTTAHFRILAGPVDPAVTRSVADALESNYPRLVADMRTGELAMTDVWLWQDSEAFYADMEQVIGRRYQGSGGYVRGAHAVSVLVVSNTPLHAVHEFAHVVSLAVNPTFANNPRWLWETVALYENRQFVDPATLEDLRAGRFPTLADLDSDFDVARKIYSVGYVLGEFIVSAWGMDALLALVRANGRLQEVVGVSTSEFEQRWYAWLRARYLAAPQTTLARPVVGGLGSSGAHLG